MLVEKTTELSHYSTNEINQIQGMRVRRGYRFQADVTAKNKGMDSKNTCRKLQNDWNFWDVRYQSGYEGK